MKKYVIIIITLLTGISCNRESNKPHTIDEYHSDGEDIVMLNRKQVEAMDLKLGTFEIRPMTTVVRTNGELEVSPSGSADVTAVIGGNVKEILVFHGDRVKKGQSMVVLEHPDYIALQQEFAEVSSNLEYLENEFNRQQELFNSNVNATKNFQLAKSEYNSAKARYQGLRSRLELININPVKVLEGNISSEIRLVSPIDGFVNDVKIKIGTYAEPGDVLFSVSNNNEIHADFMVYEKDVHHIRQGQRINFTVANRPGEELTATIFAIGKEFEPNLRAVHIHARLDKNPGNLIPGMYISGHIHSHAVMSRTLPEDAVVGDGGRSFIFVLDEVEEREHVESETHQTGEKAVMAFRMVEVVTGLTDAGYIEVDLVGSIADNAQIVLNSAYYLLADMKKEETEHVH